MEGLTSMARLPKIAQFTLIASLLGGAAIVPVVLSGQASAQSGSRICGRKWFNIDSEGRHRETIYKLYEVDKSTDFFACTSAMNGGGSQKDPTAVLSGVLVFDDWSESTIDKTTCEDISNSVGFLEYRGENWADTSNTSDICMNMTKSLDPSTMTAYWLISNINTGYNTWVLHG